MALTHIQMPAMGESIHEATVLNWLKQPGQAVALDEPLLEVATDKVDTEIMATAAGVLKEILVPAGGVAAVGRPICVLESEATAAPEIPAPEEVIQAALALQKDLPPPARKDRSASDRFYSPLVLNISRQEHISQAELDSVPGTGAGGRVTKQDMLNYVKNRSQPARQPDSIPQVKAPSPAPEKAVSPAGLPGGGDEIREMDRMRRMIADRMVDSQRTAAHVTSFLETDMTAIVRWRERMKAEFEKTYREKLTYTPILVEAVVKAIQDFPLINAQIDGSRILLKKDINIGLAVALPDGNLIVPVIHRAEQYNLIGLARRVNDLSQRARNNALKPDDLTGGTYTISNIGTFGNLMGTPIILQPQVAIMAFGAIVKKPAVLETPEGDVIAIRHRMFLSHAYDHRLVDGSLGGQFVKRVSDYLEGFDANRSL